MNGRMTRAVLVFTLAVFCLTMPATAEKITGYEELLTLLPGGMSTMEENKAVIEEAQKKVAERQMLRKKREIRFLKPLSMDLMNEKYMSLAFEVEVVPKKPSVFALLFEINGDNPLSFPNVTYLHWVGRNDLNLFSRMSREELYRNYQDMGVADCRPGFVRTGLEKTLLGKADLIHSHDASVLVTGTVDESRVDARIARDSEVAAIVSGLEKKIEELERKLSEITTLLSGVTRSNGTITFSNVNLQLVNGKGATGIPNGKGNLIVGYNEPRGNGDVRGGSHNIVVGSRNNYGSVGGLVTGSGNDISGRYSVVLGGHNNLASGEFSSVTGGARNNAKGRYTSISGQTERTKVGALENPHFQSP